MRGILALLAFVLSGGVAMAQSESILPNAMTTFVDGNGAPYSGGRVFFYVPGTTTPKATWQDPNGTTLNTNPVILDSNGRGIIWASGEYREVLEDQFGNIIWDQLTLGSNGLNNPIFTGLATFGGTFSPSLQYTATFPGTTLMSVVLGSLGTPDNTLSSAAVFEKFSSEAQLGNNGTTYTVMIKTTNGVNANGTAGFFETDDLGGGASTFSEGIDSRCIVVGSQGTCGNVFLSGDNPNVAYGNLIGGEGTVYNNSGVDAPLFSSININHEATAFIASSDGSNKPDAAFVVNANSITPFQTGFLALGSSVPNAGSGVGVNDTAFATLGNMAKGIDLSKSFFSTSAIYLSSLLSQGITWADNTGVWTFGTNGGMEYMDNSTQDIFYNNWTNGVFTFRGGIGANNVEFKISPNGAQLIPVNFSSLPTCVSGLSGSIRPVQDSNTTTYNATIAGGGSGFVMALCNGTNWTAH